MNVAPSSSNEMDDRQFIELRSRCSKNLLNRLDDDSPVNGQFCLNGRVFVDHEIKPNDTLNGISLQYSVQVAEIKRANGLVTDQEIFGLKYIRVPVPPHSSHILNNAMPSSSTLAVMPFGETVPNGVPSIAPVNLTSHHNYITSNIFHRNAVPSKGETNYIGMDSGKVPLLQDYDNDSGGSSGDEVDNSASELEFLTSDSQQNTSAPNGKKKRTTANHAIKNILDKADATVAAVRENLSERSPTLEHGRGFHFIDATAPDTTGKGVWLLFFSVIFMFVIVPLILTLMEEKSEEEQMLLHGQSQQRHHSHQGDVSA